MSLLDTNNKFIYIWDDWDDNGYEMSNRYSEMTVKKQHLKDTDGRNVNHVF